MVWNHAGFTSDVTAFRRTYLERVENKAVSVC